MTHARGHHGRGGWSVDEDDRLLSLYEAGVPDREVASQLGRTQATVVNRRSKILRRLGLHDVFTTRRVGAIFGVTNACVRNWIRRGWLVGTPSGWLRRCRDGEHRAWWIRHADVLAFMEDERYWARWWPEDMPAGHWRDVALHLRGPHRFLTVVEAGRLLGYTPCYLVKLIRAGRLRGLKGCARFPSGRKGSRAWYVRADWLDDLKEAA